MSADNFEAVKVAASSNVRAVTYCAEKKQLRVTFGSGQYEYEGVPQKVVDAWTEADSSGKFFHSSVRGKFDSRKIEPELPPGPTFCSVCGVELEDDELCSDDVPGHGGLHSYCGYG